MKNIIIVFLLVWINTDASAQSKEILQMIARELDSFKTYESYCYYTFSFPFGDPISIESTITTKKVPEDTLCGFYYFFKTNKHFTEEFGDFSGYFDQTVYSSYQDKLKKTSLLNNPNAFQRQYIGKGYRPAIHRAPQLFQMTPYQIAERIRLILDDDSYQIHQESDTVIDENLCLRFTLKNDSARAPDKLSDENAQQYRVNAEFCFEKTRHFPVYYLFDAKSSFINSFKTAHFTGTRINFELSPSYFSEENLLPRNQKKVTSTEVRKNPGDLVGKKAPDWNLPVLGKNEMLSNNSLYGKYVLIEFAATWCGHCIEASEMMNRIEARFKDHQNVAVVSIFSSNIDTEEGILDFASKLNLQSTVLYSAVEVGKQYNIYSYPNFMIISPKGKVLMNFQGYNRTVENNIINLLSEFVE